MKRIANGLDLVFSLFCLMLWVLIFSLWNPMEVQAGHWVDMGTFKCTSYCSCRKCNGVWAGEPTASGVMPVEGETVAVDKNVIPLGSMLMIDGHIYWAQDTGFGIKGKRIDVFIDVHQRALDYGVQKHQVFIWREDE